MMIKIPELLAPAGNFEKLEIAIHYGADAVYLAGKDFSLRNFSGNFTDAELVSALALARKKNVKTYLALNIYSRNHEQGQITSFLEKIGNLHPDAVIISDPGILMLAGQIIPHVDIHLSTQANTTNINAARFWKKLGVKRVNLARELSLEEVRQIAIQSGMETEIFIHGAMCISYSGRCLLSGFLSNRDSNRGLCSHPCRWRYSVVEEVRPGEFHPVAEDERGSYIFNSKDLCMIEYIPELVQANVTSLKIEGRMKGINYLASVVKTYRNALDAYARNPQTYHLKEEWCRELTQTFHRPFCTGFYLGNSEETLPNYANSHQGEIHSFIGKVLETYENGRCLVEIRNRIGVKDRVAILSARGPVKESGISSLTDSDMNPIDYGQPNTRAFLKLEYQAHIHDIIRKIR